MSLSAKVAPRDGAPNRDGADALTGAGNRRHFFEFGERELGRAAHVGRSVALLSIDFDDLRQINIQFGYVVCDRLLRDLVTACRGELRAVDILGRIGGDELAILAPDFDIEEAHLLAERLRAKLAAVEVAAEAGRASVTASVTASIGVILCDPEASVEQALARAEQAIFAAKDEGGNRVTVG